MQHAQHRQRHPGEMRTPACWLSDANACSINETNVLNVVKVAEQQQQQQPQPLAKRRHQQHQQQQQRPLRDDNHNHNHSHSRSHEPINDYDQQSTHQMLQSCGNYSVRTNATTIGTTHRRQRVTATPTTTTTATATQITTFKKPMRFTFAIAVGIVIACAIVCSSDAVDAVQIASTAIANETHALSKRSLQLNVACLEGKRFYRDPDRAVHKIWTNSECAKYFLCLEDEVFEFKCSEGLLFDVLRQICDFKQNVDNCDITAETQVPRPLLAEADCGEDESQMGCGDGTCLPGEYFCDGSVDCPDGSDEGWCDIAHDPNAAGACDPRQCQLPDCFCSKDGTQIPGRLDPHMVPQMIVLTFDDAVNFDNWELYSKILFTPQRRNPNGCPIRATFFVSHPYTNYQYVQKLWNDGHEIGVHSVTHRGPEMWWSHNATIEDWFDEMVGQANILNKFASVRMEDIRGIRVPFLRVGWNRQFLMMKEFGFAYDASMVAPFSNPPLWPYTLDYKMPHSCTGMNQNCPTRSYPGVWEMIMNQLEAGDYSCGMVDSCPAHFTGDDVYRMLTHNFKRHYLSNRAPYGLYFHSAWFKKVDYLNAFLKFIDDVQKLPDAYFVTNQQAIQWMRNPTPSNQLHHFIPWSCKPKQLEMHEVACPLPNTCKLRSRVLQQDRFFYTCKECPAQYPWLRNEFGLD